MDWFEEFTKDMTLEEINQLQFAEPNPDDENMVKFCSKCGSSDFHEIVTDRIDFTVTEIEIRCNNCDKLVNYWGYGHFDNFTFIDDDYKKMKRQKKLERICYIMNINQ